MNARISVLVNSVLLSVTLAACSKAHYEPDLAEMSPEQSYDAPSVDAEVTTDTSQLAQATEKKSEAMPATITGRNNAPPPPVDAVAAAEPESEPEEAAMEYKEASEDYDLADDMASAGDIAMLTAGATRRGALAKDKSRRSRGDLPAGHAASGLVGGATAGPMIAANMPSAQPVSIPDIAAASDPVSNTEDYTDYGVNDLVLAEQDRLSTFSIDVDTASYTISRRKLQSGALPPTAGVRVEEFVNYFPYEYVGPTGDAPFAVNMEAAPNPFQPGHHVMRVGVQGRMPSADRDPIHLTFLVDTSGSMSSADKLGLAQQSLHQLVENLGPTDTVAIATYAGSVRKVLSPTPARSPQRIHEAIDALSAGGGTAMSSGVDLAYEMASAAQVRGHENRVIVLSDGDANIGQTSHDELLRMIKRYAEEGITLSTIGLGMGNYKDTMMEQLSNKGDGNYYYIDSKKEAEKVFGDDLGGTLEVIAKDVKIQVEFNPDAVIGYRLIGYENRDIADKDFRNDRVDAGEIGAGHKVTALYDVVLKDGYREADLATVRLRNKKPGRDSAAIEWETTFPEDLLHDEFASSSDDFRLAFGAATFAELLRGSPYVSEVTYSRVWEVVNDAKRRGEETHSELLDLIGTAGQLSGEQGSVAWR